MNRIEETKYGFDTKHNRRITTTLNPIIDQATINTINQANEGFLNLSMVTIANAKSNSIALSAEDLQLFKNQNKDCQAVISGAKTVTNTSALSQFVGNAYQILRNIYPTVLSCVKLTVYCTYCLIVTITISLMDKKGAMKGKDISDMLDNFHSFIDQLYWLVE